MFWFQRLQLRVFSLVIYSAVTWGGVAGLAIPVNVTETLHAHLLLPLHTLIQKLVEHVQTSLLPPPWSRHILSRLMITPALPRPRLAPTASRPRGRSMTLPRPPSTMPNKIPMMLRYVACDALSCPSK